MPEVMSGRGARFAFGPLLLLWLALHVVLLAALLGMKLLFTKTTVVAMLLAAGAVFVITRFRAMPRKLSHSP
jgi:hypothetical protein